MQKKTLKSISFYYRRGTEEYGLDEKQAAEEKSE